MYDGVPGWLEFMPVWRVEHARSRAAIDDDALLIADRGSWGVGPVGGSHGRGPVRRTGWPMYGKGYLWHVMASIEPHCFAIAAAMRSGKNWARCFASTGCPRPLAVSRPPAVSPVKENLKRVHAYFSSPTDNS